MLADCVDTYDREPEDDLACLLLFRARSLSPCVTPFLSSSSLYCNTKRRLARKIQHPRVSFPTGCKTTVKATAAQSYFNLHMVEEA